MRGTVIKIQGQKCIPGITPADAGNSARVCPRARVYWDHPRGCGEQHTRKREALTALGSPPRMRGTGRELRTFGARCRITPADAGNSLSVFPMRRLERDHPRGCGEQDKGTSRERPGLGSPPRMRGTECGGECFAVLPRITPADAGNRTRRRKRRGPRRDHPRGCGEQACGTPARVRVCGSPPRMRGTVIFLLAFALSVRITPADAGNRLKIPSARLAL